MTNSGLKNHREKTAQRADDENECGMHCWLEGFSR
jgi:hypothetical protein